MTHSSPNPYAGSPATHQPTPNHGSPCFHIRQHSLCSPTHMGGHRAPRMHNSHTLPITTCQPTIPYVITSQLPCRHLACGQLHMGPSGSLAVFLSPGALPGPRKGSCSPSQTSMGPSSRETCSQPPLPSTHLASSPERSPSCGSLECGGLRGQQRRETARQFWAKMREYVQVNLPGLGLCDRARGFLVCEFARSSVHM
uniref:Uncharacterized protein n=1 Tax=Myotis myotis TaxID=51298 RepID=A0A7J7ZYC8_MYOMY|nr:hypothetical protein mMyoMyo1_009646 [Myotis myotis]